MARQYKKPRRPGTLRIGATTMAARKEEDGTEVVLKEDSRQESVSLPPSEKENMTVGASVSFGHQREFGKWKIEVAGWCDKTTTESNLQEAAAQCRSHALAAAKDMFNETVENLDFPFELKGKGFVNH